MKIWFCVWSEKKQRVDMYLSTLLSEYSRSYVQKMIERGQVKVNQKTISKNIPILPKDEIEIEIVLEAYGIPKENLPLEIIYQDENLVILNKDAGVNVHPTPGEFWKTGTLVNALLYHIKDLSGIWGVERPGIVHRLDKDTSWLLMVAKNDDMMRYLQNIIKKREHIWKYYLAVVKGVIKEKHIKIESMIGRHPHNRLKMTTKNGVNPRNAISYVTVLDVIDEKYTLVEVKIETWRTHQIRVHLSSIGYPIVWDSVYWEKGVNELIEKKYGLTRQALHAYKLELLLYGKQMTFFAPLKEDLKKIIPHLPYWKMEVK